ncbi:hypothetical protein SASPL_117242 [Salvia splendens]|uniref:TF-B3 domain-containing protein n=1 Tax=Salvia splendens TaxID=180675 RepID=A0A8X8XUH4_SALSN|nr:hypothetical protein SASPL_117242 [Salvia splendens]
MSPSSSEDAGIEHLKIKTMKLKIVKVEVKTEDVEAGDDMGEKPPEKRDTEMVADAGEVGTSNSGKKRKKQDYYGTGIFKAGGMQPPLNPYFVVDVRENEMHFPIDVIRDHKIQLPETLVLVDPNGRTFETKRRSWKDGRVNYNGGWKAVYRTNMLKTGDKLICEFIGNGSGVGDMHLKISFFIAT